MKSDPHELNGCEPGDGALRYPERTILVLPGVWVLLSWGPNLLFGHLQLNAIIIATKHFNFDTLAFAQAPGSLRRNYFCCWEEVWCCFRLVGGCGCLCACFSRCLAAAE